MSIFRNNGHVNEWLAIIFADLQLDQHNHNMASTYYALLQLAEHFNALSTSNNSKNLLLQLESLQKYIECFKAAAQTHYLPAQFLLGLCYIEGMGGAESKRLGFSLIDAAAFCNFAPALYCLGGLYAHGLVELNIPCLPEQAFANYLRSANLGYKKGLRNVGICFVSGFGTSVDFDLGVQYLAAAVQQGDSQAVEILYDIYQQINSKQLREQSQTEVKLLQRLRQLQQLQLLPISASESFAQKENHVEALAGNFNQSSRKTSSSSSSMADCDAAPAQMSSGAYKIVCEQRVEPVTKSQLERRRV